MNDSAEIVEATFEAEECLIGALLIESTRGTRQAIERVAQIIAATDLHTGQQSRIFLAMLSCESPPHQVSVALELDRKGLLQEGDCAYLRLCVSVVGCSLDYEDYANAVKYYSQARLGHDNIRVRGAK